MLTCELKSNIDSVLLVKGPAIVRVKDTGLSSVGILLKPEDRIVIRENKVLPIESYKANVPLDLTLGTGGNFKLGGLNAGTRIWESIKEQIFSKQKQQRRVILLGENDSGKSTLATFLINIALSLNMRTGVIDSDLGQGDLAPPGSIGGSLVRGHIFDLRDLNGEFFSFIGTISPKKTEELVIKEIEKVQINLEKNELNFSIINTDGYVKDRGVQYKIDMLSQISPDFIIYIKSNGEDELFRKIIEEFGASNVILAEKPNGTIKNHSERKKRRISQYRCFLKNSIHVKVNLTKTRLFLLGTCYDINTDHSISPSRSKIFTKKSRSGDCLVLTPKKVYFIQSSLPEFRINNIGSLSGMFIGLGHQNRIIGFGMINKIDQENNLYISTPFKGFLDTIYLSLMYLSRNLKTEFLSHLLME